MKINHTTRLSAGFLLDVIIILFSLLFVYAASSKVLEFELFKAQIGKSPLIQNFTIYIAWAVPVIEYLVALALFIPKFQLKALYASFTIMFMFTIYIAFLLSFSPYVPCSCGGILSNMGWTEHLIFNAIFTCLSIVGIITYNRKTNTTEKSKNIEKHITSLAQ